MSAEKILITGANGFIGYHLIKRLGSGRGSVRILVRRTSDLKNLSDFSLERSYGDVCDRESLQTALREITVVFHLAGITREKHPGQFMDVNAQGTRNLLMECSRMERPPRVVFVSSLAAAGPGKKGVPKVETDPVNPVSPYGKSKHAAERFVLEFSDKVPCSIVRPPIVFGETDRASLELFRILKKSRTHLVPGWWNPEFSYIHAEDLSDFLLKTWESGERVHGESFQDGRGIYFSSCGEIYRYSEFGRMIADALKLEKIRILHCPPLAVYIAGLGGEFAKKFLGKTPPFDWNKAKESLRGPWICSNEKGEKQLKFHPEKPLRRRLEQTAQWYQEQGWMR